MTATTPESAAARLESMATPRVVDHDAMATEQRYATHLLEMLSSEIVDECVMVDEAAQAEESRHV